MLCELWKLFFIPQLKKKRLTELSHFVMNQLQIESYHDSLTPIYPHLCWRTYVCIFTVHSCSKAHYFLSWEAFPELIFHRRVPSLFHTTLCILCVSLSLFLHQSYFAFPLLAVLKYYSEVFFLFKQMPIYIFAIAKLSLNLFKNITISSHN